MKKKGVNNKKTKLDKKPGTIHVGTIDVNELQRKSLGRYEVVCRTGSHKSAKDYNRQKMKKETKETY